MPMPELHITSALSRLCGIFYLKLPLDIVRRLQGNSQNSIKEMVGHTLRNTDTSTICEFFVNNLIFPVSLRKQDYNIVHKSVKPCTE